MQVKFHLSKDTSATLQPDGRYEVANNTGHILLDVGELRVLKTVDDLAEKSKHDLPADDLEE